MLSCRALALVVTVGLVPLGGCTFTPAGGELEPGGDGGGGGRDAGADAGGTVTDAAPPLTDAIAVAVDARPACPGEYLLTVNGSRYVRRVSAALLDNARSDCEDDLPGRTGLATFEDATDLDAVLTNLGPSGSEQLWVGARCTFGMFGCSGADTWTWDSGAAVDAALWSANEPDNPFTERSAMTIKTNGRWRLATTGTIPIEAHTYVCECRD